MSNSDRSLGILHTCKRRASPVIMHTNQIKTKSRPEEQVGKTNQTNRPNGQTRRFRGANQELRNSYASYRKRQKVRGAKCGDFTPQELYGSPTQPLCRAQTRTMRTDDGSCVSECLTQATYTSDIERERAREILEMFLLFLAVSLY